MAPYYGINPLLEHSVMARDRKEITVLPATHSRTIPAFTRQLQSITALWLVIIVPIHREMAKLSWPGSLVMYWDRFSRTKSSTRNMVTHPVLTGPGVE